MNTYTIRYSCGHATAYEPDPADRQAIRADRESPKACPACRADAKAAEAEQRSAERAARVAAIPPIPLPTQRGESWVWSVQSSRGRVQTYTVSFRQWMTNGREWDNEDGLPQYAEKWQCDCSSRQRPCKHVLAVQERYSAICTMDDAYASGDVNEMDHAEHGSDNGQWVLRFVPRQVA